MDADLELAGDITTLKKELLPRLLGNIGSDKIREHEI
jgi:hypothetical protein